MSSAIQSGTENWRQWLPQLPVVDGSTTLKAALGSLLICKFSALVLQSISESMPLLQRVQSVVSFSGPILAIAIIGLYVLSSLGKGLYRARSELDDHSDNLNQQGNDGETTPPTEERRRNHSTDPLNVPSRILEGRKKEVEETLQKAEDLLLSLCNDADPLNVSPQILEGRKKEVEETLQRWPELIQRLGQLKRRKIEPIMRWIYEYEIFIPEAQKVSFLTVAVRERFEWIFPWSDKNLKISEEMGAHSWKNDLKCGAIQNKDETMALLKLHAYFDDNILDPTLQEVLLEAKPPIQALMVGELSREARERIIPKLLEDSKRGRELAMAIVCESDEQDLISREITTPRLVHRLGKWPSPHARHCKYSEMTQTLLLYFSYAYQPSNFTQTKQTLMVVRNAVLSEDISQLITEFSYDPLGEVLHQFQLKSKYPLIEHLELTLMGRSEWLREIVNFCKSEREGLIEELMSSLFFYYLLEVSGEFNSEEMEAIERYTDDVEKDISLEGLESALLAASKG